MWLSFSHHKCTFASMSLGDYVVVLSAWNQNVWFCCLEPLAHWLSSFSVLADAMQRIPMLAKPELTLTLWRILGPLIFYHVVASRCQGPKSFGLNGGQMHRLSGLSLILNPRNQRFFSLSYQSCLLPIVTGALPFPFIGHSKNLTIVRPIKL